MPEMQKKPQKEHKVARRIIHGLDHAVNFIVLLIFLAMVAAGGYAIWDNHMIYRNADSRQFETYAPESNDSPSFRELQKLNPETVGWISVYGTGISHPFAQGRDDEKYISTGIDGKPNLSGAVFLYCRNDRHFRDFNSILYGHHMENHAMFGDLDRFEDAAFFRTHRYGDLYYDGRHHGLVIFAYLKPDAYDATVYSVAKKDRRSQDAYLKNLTEKAVRKRSIDLPLGSRIVLLSTCGKGGTNQRYVVAAKITDKTYKNQFKDEEKSLRGGPFWKELPFWWWIAVVAMILFVVWLSRRNKRRKRGEEADAQDAQSS